jgi:hypothetical protein
MVASGGAANSVRICPVKACFAIIDESSLVTTDQPGLVQWKRENPDFPAP